VQSGLGLLSLASTPTAKTMRQRKDIPSLRSTVVL